MRNTHTTPTALRTVALPTIAVIRGNHRAHVRNRRRTPWTDHQLAIGAVATRSGKMFSAARHRTERGNARDLMDLCALCVANVSVVPGDGLHRETTNADRRPLPSFSSFVRSVDVVLPELQNGSKTTLLPITTVS